jgi:putative transposase
MSTQRKQYGAEFKARVALEALKGLKTVNELASTYGVHPTQIAHWKHRLQKEMPDIFSARRAKREHDQEAFQAQLYQQIGPVRTNVSCAANYNCAPYEVPQTFVTGSTLSTPSW